MRGRWKCSFRHCFISGPGTPLPWLRAGRPTRRHPTGGSTARSVLVKPAALKPRGLQGFSAVFLPELFPFVRVSTCAAARPPGSFVPSLPAAGEKPSGLFCLCELSPWFALHGPAVGWPELGECQGKARLCRVSPAAGRSVTLWDTWQRRGPPLPALWVPGVCRGALLPPGLPPPEPLRSFPPPAPALERQNSA